MYSIDNIQLILIFSVTELEQTAALRYLYGWLHHHPKYKTLTSPEIPMSLYYADVCSLWPLLKWSYEGRIGQKLPHKNGLDNHGNYILIQA